MARSLLQDGPRTRFLVADPSSESSPVILTSVLRAGNHALFAGARVLYGLAGIKQAPAVFKKTNRNQVSRAPSCSHGPVGLPAMQNADCPSFSLWNRCHGLPYSLLPPSPSSSCTFGAELGLSDPPLTPLADFDHSLLQWSIFPSWRRRGDLDMV